METPQLLNAQLDEFYEKLCKEASRPQLDADGKLVWPLFIDADSEDEVKEVLDRMLKDL